MLLRTARMAEGAGLGAVTVLAGDDRILEAARAWGLRAVAAFGPTRNGSERIAAAIEAGAIPRSEVVLNLQGDAVGATPDVLRAAVAALEADPGAGLATVVVRAADGGGRTTASIAGGRALDFSREALLSDGAVHRHIGVYAYRVDELLRVAALPPGPRELARSLEQLRWLEHGLPVAVAVLGGPTGLADAVDVETDFAPPPDPPGPGAFRLDRR